MDENTATVILGLGVLLFFAWMLWLIFAGRD